MSATAMAAVGPSLFTHKTTTTSSTTNQLRLHSSLTYIHLRHHFFKPISISSPSRHLALITPAAVAEEEAVLETAAETETETETETEKKQEEEKEEGDEICTKLYFGNLPYHCDSAQLAGIVEQYANPELIEVLYNRDTGRSRGFAFVTMSSVEDCNAIIENLDESEYGGRYLRVNFADKPRKREPLFPETEHKLFIGNLSWSVTSDSLYQAFRAYGDIVGARVLYDGETGKSRGYGFVCYATRSEMENALASLNGMELEGRAIRVSMAEGKKL
ncbi:28 kDa ribonucleoprotein, chloroplastic-like [Silene latifolia]|uniref:28 kDa ribonucleoprotein, chloroplastic-like n=1 Tax=Silene latifolia TaxID=37657 RepID=UPI003D76F7FA